MGRVRGLKRDTPVGVSPGWKQGLGALSLTLSVTWVGHGLINKTEIEFRITSSNNVRKSRDYSMLIILSLLKRHNLSLVKRVIVETIVSLTSDELSRPHSLSGFDFL